MRVRLHRQSGPITRLRYDPPECAAAHLFGALGLEHVVGRLQLALAQHLLQRGDLVRLHRMQARARALGAAAVDRPGGEIEVAHAQVHELRGAQPVPVREQDHRVVARAVARAFLGGAEKRGDFVAGEVVAEAWFGGHANNLPRAPSPSSPRAEQPRCTRVARGQLRSHAPLSCQTSFSAPATRNITPKALPVSAMKRKRSRRGNGSTRPKRTFGRFRVVSCGHDHCRWKKVVNARVLPLAAMCDRGDAR